MARSRRSEAAARAEADRAYLESVRGDASSATGPGDPHGARPVAPGPTPIEQTDVMPYVPTAAPTPALGVSPILGESAGTTPPPAGSFTAPPVGPPGPAFPSSAFTPAPEPAVPPSPVPSQASGAADFGVEPGPLRRAGSYVDQNPSSTPTMTMSPPLSSASSAAGYPSLLKQPPVSPGYDLPLFLGPNGIAPTGDLVTCPECGEMATVDAGRRKSEDFCRNCDFPLFWARTTVVLASGEETGASLRRLPGTVGRAATAALICPHCGEPNSPTAQTCIRCLLSLHPVEAPPPPVYLAPEPEPMPVPIGRDFPLWWILLVSACLLIITLIVVWVALN